MFLIEMKYHHISNSYVHGLCWTSYYLPNAIYLLANEYHTILIIVAV